MAEQLNQTKIALDPGIDDFKQLDGTAFARPEIESVLYAIDNPDYGDFDDAFRVEELWSVPNKLEEEPYVTGYHVEIAISDVTAYILDSFGKVSKSLLKRAETQVITRYFPGGHAKHLWGERTSTNEGSLRQSYHRPVLFLELELDVDGEVRTSQLTFAVSTRHANVTYEDNLAVLKPAFELSKRLRAKRAIQLKLTAQELNCAVETLLQANALDEKIEPNGEDDHSGNKVSVEELMILTNVEIARYCQAHDIPIFYRGVAISQEKMSPFYTSQPSDHKSLGVEVYTHATSPLRRIVDAVAISNLWAYWQHESKYGDAAATHPINWPFPPKWIADHAEHFTDVYSKRRKRRRSQSSVAALRLQLDGYQENSDLDVENPVKAIGVMLQKPSPENKEVRRKLFQFCRNNIRYFLTVLALGKHEGFWTTHFEYPHGQTNIPPYTATASLQILVGDMNKYEATRTQDKLSPKRTFRDNLCLELLRQTLQL